ncbi:MAG: exodeoxyribonuclease VII small subunit [Deltaproteobacteria bacterium]|jgi:exodeoxyribonuclease VII small subunit|nr:exodeoxyribonuclease VII small subunit [Deltaproteobacteria bacterium]
MEFEKKLKRLEDIVEKMESGDLSLDDSMKLFEEGVKMSRECQSQLTVAEEKVKLLLSIDADGKAVTRDFDPDDDSGEA